MCHSHSWVSSPLPLSPSPAYRALQRMTEVAARLFSDFSASLAPSTGRGTTWASFIHSFTHPFARYISGAALFQACARCWSHCAEQGRSSPASQISRASGEGGEASIGEVLGWKKPRLGGGEGRCVVGAKIHFRECLSCGSCRQGLESGSEAVTFTL